MPARKVPTGEPSNERTLLDDLLEALRAYPDAVRVTTATKGMPVAVKQVWRDTRIKELRLLVGNEGPRDEIGLDEITSFTTEELTRVQD